MLKVRRAKQDCFVGAEQYCPEKDRFMITEECCPEKEQFITAAGKDSWLVRAGVATGSK